MKKMYLRAAALVMGLLLLCAPVSAEIRKGDSGENVAELQRMLLELGFLEDEPDGSYGQKTEAAVKLFQTYCGLKADGRASDDLVAMVFDLYATAFGVMEGDGLSDAELKDRYPASCSFQSKDVWSAVYCWRHLDQGYLSSLIYRPGAPAKLERVLTKRGCELWMRAMSVMFAEWEASLPAEERNVVTDRRASFEAVAEELLGDRMDDSSDASLLNAYVYLEEYGIELCRELYGE